MRMMILMFLVEIYYVTPFRCLRCHLSIGVIGPRWFPDPRISSLSTFSAENLNTTHEDIKICQRTKIRTILGFETSNAMNFCNYCAFRGANVELSACSNTWSAEMRRVRKKSPVKQKARKNELQRSESVEWGLEKTQIFAFLVMNSSTQLNKCGFFFLIVVRVWYTSMPMPMPSSSISIFQQITKLYLMKCTLHSAYCSLVSNCHAVVRASKCMSQEANGTTEGRNDRERKTEKAKNKTDVSEVGKEDKQRRKHNCAIGNTDSFIRPVAHCFSMVALVAFEFYRNGGARARVCVSALCAA